MYMLLQYLPFFVRKGRLNIWGYLIIIGIMLFSAGLTFISQQNAEAETLINPVLNLISGEETDLRSNSLSNEDEGSFNIDLPTIQSNSLTPILNPSEPTIKVVRKISVIVTAYSSSPWETDNDPTITAAGTTVREGIIASNLLPFGTKIILPDIYGNKIFIVEDRMNSRKGAYQIDIWFPSRQEALEFGAKLTKMEVVEEI